MFVLQFRFGFQTTFFHGFGRGVRSVVVCSSTVVLGSAMLRISPTTDIWPRLWLVCWVQLSDVVRTYVFNTGFGLVFNLLGV